MINDEDLGRFVVCMTHHLGSRWEGICINLATLDELLHSGLSCTRLSGEYEDR